MEKRDANVESRSVKIKKGIARARSMGRRWGRPTIIETSGDPQLASKVAQLRSEGLSWAQISVRLNISRTSARRLFFMCQKDDDCQIENASIRNVSGDLLRNKEEQEETNKSNNLIQHHQFPNNDVLSRLPKTFQLFNSLLEKVRRNRSKKVYEFNFLFLSRKEKRLSNRNEGG